MADEPIIIVAGGDSGGSVDAAVEADVIEPVAETVADAAVEVAAIEAERDVAIAEIHADVELAHIEARAEENAVIEEVETWQKSIEDRMQAQEATLLQMQSNLETLVERLNPPPPPNPPEPEGPEVTGASPEVEAPVPDEPVRKAKPLRWI